MKSLVIFDATRKPSLLDESWGVGSFSMWFRGRVDGMLGATSWKEVFNWLSIKGEKEKIKEVQFWGHGSPGEAYINNDKITHNLIYGNNFMDKDGLFWFRTCSTFNSKNGKQFANLFSKFLNCRVAGHTYKIGFPTHSGLHVVSYNKEAYWPDGEGSDKNGNILGSSIFKKNTIFFFQNKIK